MLCILKTDTSYAVLETSYSTDFIDLFKLWNSLSILILFWFLRTIKTKTNNDKKVVILLEIENFIFNPHSQYPSPIIRIYANNISFALTFFYICPVPIVHLQR